MKPTFRRYIGTRMSLKQITYQEDYRSGQDDILNDFFRPSFREAGIGIDGAFTQGITGKCGFCQLPVRYGPTMSDTNCVAMPHIGKASTLYICKKCTGKGKKYLKEMKQCCMCGKPI